MEYHCSKDPSVATRIFELGLKVFGEKIEFVDRYLSFLITINDDQSELQSFGILSVTPDSNRWSFVQTLGFCSRSLSPNSPQTSQDLSGSDGLDTNTSLETSHRPKD